MAPYRSRGDLLNQRERVDRVVPIVSSETAVKSEKLMCVCVLRDACCSKKEGCGKRGGGDGDVG